MQARIKNPAVIMPGAMQAIQTLMASAQKAGMPPKVLQLVHLRASQVNGCGPCVDGGVKHAKQATGSEHVQCLFTAASPEPDCVSHVALGGSLLVFQGSPAKVVGGAGRYLGATGRVLSNKTVGDSNDSDVVAKITRR